MFFIFIIVFIWIFNIKIGNFKCFVVFLCNFVIYGEVFVVCCWFLDIGDLGYVGKVNNIKLVVENELFVFLVEGYKIWVVGWGKGEGVEEEEGKDDNDGD